MVPINLDRLFNPRRIAMIGASDHPLKWGHIILLNILKGDYQGTVYPVNPGKKSILGYPCYPSVHKLPEKPDVAIITTPARSVSSLIDDCGRMQIPFVIVITSDFSETGPEGAALEREIVAKANQHGIRMVGPNSMGIFSVLSRLHAMMPPPMPLPGDVSMFSQSGNIGVQMLAWGVSEGVGFGKFVSSGNEGDLNCVDYLRYFAEDNDTRVVVGYLEGIDPGTPFFPAAKEASSQKPILIFKGGRTAAGGKAAASHSGAMAGESGIYSAAFKQAGIIEAGTSQTLMDCAKAFSHYPIPRGRRIGIITRGGGWGVITADACSEYGLAVPSLSEKLMTTFDALLPKYWSRSNPVDLVATIAGDPYLECLEMMAAWDGVDAVIALGAGRGINTYPHSDRVKGPRAVMEAVAFMKQYFKQRREKPDDIMSRIGRLVERDGQTDSGGVHRTGSVTSGELDRLRGDFISHSGTGRAGVEAHGRLSKMAEQEISIHLVCT